MRWLDLRQLRPRIVGEFDDSALMQAFGQAGIGIFIAPSVIADEVQREHGVTIIGQTDEVTEQFYAISLERRLTHPAVVAINDTAHRELFRQRTQAPAGFLVLLTLGTASGWPKKAH